MRRFSIILVTVLVSVSFLGLNLNYSEVSAMEKSITNTNKKDVQLTEKQKSELTAIHREIFEKRKELIAKYVEFGVIDEEKGKIIISKLEKRYEYAEENGFIRYHDRDCHNKRNWNK